MVDLSEGRASEGIDQQEPNSIHVQDWLVCVKGSAEEDVVVEDTMVEYVVVEDAVVAVECYELNQ